MALRRLAALLGAAAAQAVVLRGGGRGGAGGPRVVAFLSTKAEELGSVELTVLSHEAMLAARRSGDPEGLDKVKDMIRDMITQKKSELASSVSRSQYCDAEMPKAKAELTKVKDQIDETTAEHDKMAAKMAEMKDENDDLAARIASTHKNISASQARRDEEHAAYAEVKAKYEKTQAEDTNAAMEAQIKVEREEAAKALAFRRWLSDAEVGMKADEKKIKLNEAAIIKMQVDMANTNRDADSQKDLLQAVQKYKSQLEKQCVVRTESYEERKRRRDQEIESMKDAYVILGGDP